MHDEGRHPFGAGAGRDRGEDDEPLGEGRVGDPRLLPGQHVVVAVEVGPGGDRRRVGPDPRLSRRQRGQRRIVAGQRREQALLLFGGAEFQYGRGEEPPEVIRFPMEMSPWHSSSCTRHWVTRSVTPPPPYSSGIMNEVSPTFARLRPEVTRQHGRPRRPPARGAGSRSAANSRASATTSACSGAQLTAETGDSGHGLSSGTGRATIPMAASMQPPPTRTVQVSGSP